MSVSVKMHSIFIHSQPIDPAQVQKTGAFTTLPVRVHKHNHLADDASLRALHDWDTHMGDHAKRPIPVSISDIGNAHTCSLIEALPERLPILAYLGDIGIIYDDYCEDLDAEQALVEYKRLERSLDVSDQYHEERGPRDLAVKNMMAQCVLDMIQIDREFGIYVLKAYHNDWLAAVGCVPEINDYAAYVSHRMGDGGFRVWWVMMEFAMDIRLSQQEKDVTANLFETINECFILTQDYWSWDREYYFWKSKGNRILNAVDIISRQESVSPDEAKDKVKQAILRLEKEIIEKKNSFFNHHPDVSHRLKRWIETAVCVIGAHHYWASQCPRHHAFLTTHDQRPSGSDSKLINMASEYTKHPPITDTDHHLASEEKTPRTGTKRENVDESQQSPSCSKRIMSDLAWHKLDAIVLNAPCQYVRSLPSKGIRNMLITALNGWLHAPVTSVKAIEQLVSHLHDASLVLDDIEDNSTLRRGRPATHMIFGPAQAINSANFMFVQAIQDARKLQNPAAIDIVLENVENLYLGQSWDLFWKHNLICPTEMEYLNMVDSKTGGMFHMLWSLLRAECTQNKELKLERLMILMGRFFQIRDDYMNLSSTDYSDKKGFCEDLDEAKFSYLIVCLLNVRPELVGQINGIFRQRPVTQQDTLLLESKLHILHLIKDAGVFHKTLSDLKEMETQIEDEITKVEQETNQPNSMIRVVVATLSVKHLTVTKSHFIQT